MVGLAVLVSAAAAVSGGPLVARLSPAMLGGVTMVLRIGVARPDRAETRYVFLTGAATGREPPQEVQVVGPGEAPVMLADEEGADCTLSHVEIVTGPKPAVLAATRVFEGRLGDADQSRPAPMEIATFRPESGGDPGESAVVLRQRMPSVRTAPLCRLADVVRTMRALPR